MLNDWERKDLLEKLHRHVDRSIRSGFDVDSAPCKKGCNWCCYQMADCCLDEGFIIAEFIDSLPRDTKRRIHKAEKRWLKVHAPHSNDLGIDDLVDIAQLEGFNAAEKLVEKVCLEHFDRAKARNAPCPYLVDGACAVYEVRPVKCRTTYPSTGFTVEDCKTAEVEHTGLDLAPAIMMMQRAGIQYVDDKRIPEQVIKARRLMAHG